MSKILKYVRSPWFAPLIIVAALLVVGGVVWFSRDTSVGMKPYSFENGGFKYSVLFYDGAKPVRLEDGNNALTQGGEVVVTVKPVDEKRINDCTTIGSGWTEATTYELDGKTGPVCAFGNGFATILEAHGAQHLMTMTYKDKQGSGVYPVLRSVYGSLTVAE